MISIEEFQKIRLSRHLIVLDTNIFLELYRQPANVSMDVIDALKKVLDNLYMPRQVYIEYMKNYQEICGSEKKKYQKVKKELSDSVRKLQEDIDAKVNEYRKHNYTDIPKLQKELNQKIDEIHTVIEEFELGHKAENQFNLDFLNNDKVKEFVDLLEAEGKIGAEIPFTEKMLILQEGQVRFNNLIPPGYKDCEKEGADKFGDLFVWKNIIEVAKEKNASIVFVCNDVKEDWWKKKGEVPIELRDELLLEFKELNPFLDIHFLTLDKFFSYIAEELKIGKSKSALQLSAMDDVGKLLDKYDNEIYQKIEEVLCSIDINEELGEEFIETGEENIYWDILDVSVEKEEKKILYYITLDISVLADLLYQEPGNYPFDAGKIALALEGKIQLSIEEYATESILQVFEIEMSDILHIESKIWKTIKTAYRGETCKDIIAASRAVEEYSKSVNRIKEGMTNSPKVFGDLHELSRIVQQNEEMQEKVIAPLSDLSKLMPPQEVVESFRQIAKVLEPFYGKD